MDRVCNNNLYRYGNKVEYYVSSDLRFIIIHKKEWKQIQCFVFKLFGGVNGIIISYFAS